MTGKTQYCKEPMQPTEKEQFSPLRTFLWPVHRFELKKLLPMLALFFLISLDYSMLRTMKDALLVTAKGSGAEVIPFIKVWVILPAALAITAVFTRLAGRYSQEKVFYIIFSGFLTFFFVFITILYPLRDTIHPHAFADHLQTVLPLGLKGFVAMIRYWSFTLFYVMSELWSSCILLMLFWGFANEITKIDEAKRFYGLFGIGANFSGIFAGQISILLTRTVYSEYLPFGEDAWHQSLILILGFIILVGVATLVLFRWMHSNVLNDTRFYDPEEAARKDPKVAEGKAAQKKMSVRANFRYIFRSPYLTSMMLIVVAYNVVINLVEVLWKHQVRELYPNPAEYNLYMNQITSLIGVLATLAALFISGNSLRRRGWTFTALIAPVILLVTSFFFFGAFFFKGSFSSWLLAIPVIGGTPLAIVVFFGSLQNVLSRSSKYTVFDASREMAYIPLSGECRVRGKSAIDGVGSRLGKSGGSVCYQVLLVLCSTISASAPYVAVILVAVIGIWIASTLSLGKLFNSLTKHEEGAKEAAGFDELESENLAVTTKITDPQTAV